MRSFNSDEGKLIKVRVVADAKQEALVVETEDTLSVETRTKAERGKANQRVREIVAEHFSVTLGDVRIISGHHRPNKIVSVST